MRKEDSQVGVDWDGTLADPQTGQMREGAPRFLLRLKAMGLTPVVYTCRPAFMVTPVLDSEGFLELEVDDTKRRFLAYVDDRNVLVGTEWADPLFFIRRLRDGLR